jgi:hypothetical protein
VNDVPKILADKHLKMKAPPASQPAAGKEPGTVIDQDPKPGTKVKEDSEVAVTVAIPALVEIPLDVVGKQLAQAIIQLAQKQFINLGNVEEKTTAKPPGTVLRTDPVAGTKVAPDKLVTIVVAAQPDPPSPANIFFGRWANTAPNPTIKEIIIRSDANQVLVQMTGKLGTTVQDWGQAAAPMPTAASLAIDVSYVRHPTTRRLHLTVVNGQLRVDGTDNTTFPAGTSRYTETLKPAPLIRLIDIHRIPDLIHHP